MNAPPTLHSTLGIAIVSWNVRDLLSRCLQSIARSSAGEPRLATRTVVVDNASSDGSAGMVRSDFADVTLIENTANRGFTAANNQAFQALGIVLTQPPGIAQSPTPATTGHAQFPPPTYTLLLNPDTEIVANALAVLVDYLDDHPRAGAVGPMLRNPDGSEQSSRRRFPTLATGLAESTPLAWHWPGNPAARRFHMDDVPSAEAMPVDWVTGAAILVRSDLLAALGGLDEGFFMYSEELDLCRRLRDIGYETYFCPEALVVHYEGKSSDQAVGARHLQFSRSRIRYFRKHHGRVAAAVVQSGIVVGYAVETAIEAAKWLVGHKRALRRARVTAYWEVMKDGLSMRRDDRRIG